MGVTNFPNGVASYGAPIIGGGMPITAGTVYYVSYANGSDGNDGTRDTAHSHYTQPLFPRPGLLLKEERYAHYQSSDQH